MGFQCNLNLKQMDFKWFFLYTVVLNIFRSVTCKWKNNGYDFAKGVEIGYDVVRVGLDKK